MAGALVARSRLPGPAQRGGGTDLTALATRSRGAPAPAGAGPGAAAPAPARGPVPAPGRAKWADVPATVALGALTLVTVAGMGRLFQGASWVAPVLVSGAAVHAVTWAARHSRGGRGISNPVAAALSVLVTYVLLAWIVLPDTTFFGLPLGRTFTTMGHDLSQARDAFAHVEAPTPALPGFLIAAGAGAAIVAILADWAAFRLNATLEAVVPGLATLVFISLLANDHGGVLWTAGFAAAVAIFVALHDHSGHGALRARFTGGSRRRTALSGASVGLAAVVALTGALIGPHVPGSGSGAVVSVHRGPGSSGKRTTISPLVDIRDRLVSESTLEMFTVASARQAYWRLTALDHFDGNIWSSDEPYSPVGGPLPVSPPAVPGTNLQQSFDISSLGSIWLPAAYLPTRISGAPGTSWDAQSDSLISKAATSDNESYQVTSVVSQLTPSQLRQASLAPSVVAPAALTKYTQLPASVPSSVISLARQVTASTTTPYDKALALQTYLRSNFTYSLDVPPGHSDDALHQFLFVDKKGYCEQFAGAYAVMARAVGLPTRVAVGFTPGNAEADGAWHVTGSDAHAWPEVLLGQFGWVAFEPTPGRGNPAATSYTGIPAEQAAPATAASPGNQSPAPATPTTVRPPISPQVGAGSTRHSSAGSSAAGPVALLVAVIVVGVSALWAAGVPMLQAARRRRRRQRARDEADLVLAAWEEAAERLAASGTARRSGETRLEHAQRVAAEGRLHPRAAAALQELANEAAAAAYGRPEDSRGVAATASTHAAVVERAVLGAAGTWRRLAWSLDPRPRRTVTRA